MIAEYLPGRDFFCQSLWQDGHLVLVKTCERVAYFGGENIGDRYILERTA